jgi:1-acyl-sn-glycerol-3-phosphate acyltransferase
MARSLAWLLYEFAYWVIAFALTLLFSLRITGRNNLPRTGPVLIVANHQSFLDPIVVGLATRRHLAYLARKTLFANRLLGPFLRAVNSVPIDQEGVGKEGIRNILTRLQEGWAVLVFPEGERTEDGQFNPLRPGVALLLSRAQVPVVPVGIAGAYHAWPRWRRWPIPSPLFLPATDRTIAAVVGKPRDPASLKGMTREQLLETLSQDIAALIPEAERARRK